MHARRALRLVFWREALGCGLVVVIRRRAPDAVLLRGTVVVAVGIVIRLKLTLSPIPLPVFSVTPGQAVSTQLVGYCQAV